MKTEVTTADSPLIYQNDMSDLCQHFKVWQMSSQDVLVVCVAHPVTPLHWYITYTTIN